MKFWSVLITALLLTGCGESQQAAYEPVFSVSPAENNKVYVVGIHPLHNPQRLTELYGPILDQIDAATPGIKFRLEASRNYEEFERKLYSGEFDLAMPNPYQTVLSLKHGYRVFGKMGDDHNFRGIILVRRDSNIHQVRDLKGGQVAYPSVTALAATLMPQYYLHTHGLDVNRDIQNLYVGSQESAILNVLRGHVAAAATWPVPWLRFQQEHPDEAAQLEVKWQTATLPNNGWVARNDIPAEVVRQFAGELFRLQDNEQGRKLLQRLLLSRFEPATNATYAPVRDYLERFSRTVRPIER